MDKHRFPFSRQNYILLLIGIGVIILGFILMSGGKSDDPKVFNEGIFNDRRIIIAPLVVLSGYGVIMAAILKKPKTSDTGSSIKTK